MDEEGNEHNEIVDEAKNLIDVEKLQTITNLILNCL